MHNTKNKKMSGPKNDDDIFGIIDAVYPSFNVHAARQHMTSSIHYDACPFFAILAIFFFLNDQKNQLNLNEEKSNVFQ